MLLTQPFSGSNNSGEERQTTWEERTADTGTRQQLSPPEIPCRVAPTLKFDRFNPARRLMFPALNALF
jgi:hypothetical protein